MWSRLPMCAAATKLLEPSTAARTRVEPRHSDMWYGLLNPLFTAVLNYHPSSAHLLSCIVYLLLSCRSFYMFYNQMIYHTQYSWLAFSFCGYSTHKFLITSMIYKNILHLIHCIFTHLKTPFEAKKNCFILILCKVSFYCLCFGVRSEKPLSNSTS